MTRREFNQVVEGALALLPQVIRRTLDNLAVIVEDRPSSTELEDMGFGRDDVLFGLFKGIPLSERSFFDLGGHLPNQIILYQQELEDCCSNRGQLVEEITLTLVHEVGHYLGLNEAELRQLEREATGRLRAGG